VGVHGRVAALSCAIVAAQSLHVQDLTPELASKIAAAVAPATEIALTSQPADAGGADELRRLEGDLRASLSARGVRVAAAADVVVALTCGESLSERVCLAEIRRGVTREVVAATRPKDAGAPAGLPALMLTPLVVQRSPILDVAAVGDRLLVLEPTALALHERDQGGWRFARAQPLRAARAWPRDLRGRLLVDGSSVDALLPGVVCRSSVDLAPPACVEGRRPWPLPVDNVGIDAARNDFSTPEGLAFYGAATLDGGADRSALVVDRSGRLVLLDESRSAIATLSSGSQADDVIGLGAACGGGPFVVVASRGDAAHDALQLFHVSRRQLVPQGDPVAVRGRVTALWAGAQRAAVAVVHDVSADRYEAFHLRLACVR